MLDLLLGVFIVHFFALVTPGPDTLLVIRTSVLYSKRQSIFAVFGIALGVVLWSFLVILGLNALLLAYPKLNLVLHVFGIVFLSYLTLGLLKDVKNAKVQKDISFDKKISSKGLLLTGFLTNLSNPKAVMYFTLVFGSLLPVGDLKMQISALVLVTLETFAWFAFMASSFSVKKVRQFYLSKQKFLDAASAIVFATFVILLIIDLFKNFNLGN